MTALEYPYRDLAQALIYRLEDVRPDGSGDLVVPCPVDGAPAHIVVMAGPLGDAVSCDGGCQPEDIEQGLRFLARALPRTCTDARRQDRARSYEHARTCFVCLRYTDALREAVKTLQALFGRPSLGPDGDDWAPVSLVDAPAVPAPTILAVDGHPLVRQGWINLFHGARGSGKTPLTYIAAVEQVRTGNLVLLIDHEMGRLNANALLRELGLAEHEVRDGIYYVDGPGPMNLASRRRLAEEVQSREGGTGRRLTLAIIDSLTESMSTVPGSSDNDAQDVMVWFNSVPKWLVQEFGAAVFVIDHSGVVDGPRPAGSHKKQEVPQLHFWVQAVEPFSRQHDRGYSKLIVRKDRSGALEIGSVAALLRTSVGASFRLVSPVSAAKVPPGTGDVVVLPLDTQPANATDDDVLADIVARPGMSRTEVTGTGASGQYRRAALDRLVADAKVVEWKDGRRRRYRAA